MPLHYPRAITQSLAKTVEVQKILLDKEQKLTVSTLPQ